MRSEEHSASDTLLGDRDQLPVELTFQKTESVSLYDYNLERFDSLNRESLVNNKNLPIKANRLS
jgi:hypothetical protein